jgi:acetolactate synthase I/II/III large subunit
MKSKVSDLVARFFARKGVSHGFGIIGSANSHLFDSFFNTTPEIELVCNHHEQACTWPCRPIGKSRGCQPSRW